MKNILITGANGNLGVAVVKKFLAVGWRVIAADHSGSKLGEVASHADFELHEIEASNHEITTRFAEDIIAKYGQLHAALLLVGGFAMGDIYTTTLADIQKMMSINFLTAYNFADPVFKNMLQNNEGRVVLVGAKPALEATAGKNMIAYTLSKSLLFQYADLLNATAKGKNVTASVIVPGTIDTPVNRNAMPDADFSAWVKPATIADILAFICSNEAKDLRESIFKIYNNA
jgi:NAD(P)-dependent dehydrogenase (short-subunit alcohol dehydrogenase family)